MLAPQRCTPMLEWDRGLWIAKELRRACNAVPSAASITAVKERLVRRTGMPPNWTLAREMRSLAV